MHICVTGTQIGSTPQQAAALQFLLAKLSRGLEHSPTVHHGDCVGVDSEAHDIAMDLGLRVEIHPPDSPSKRAFRTGDVIHPRRPYLVRNADMALACDVIIAVPKRPCEEIRSGTWATVRAARRIMENSRGNRTIYIAWPDGQITEETSP